MYINGEWIKTEKHLEVKNPGTGEVYWKVGMVGKKETEDAIESAYTAFEPWSEETGLYRAKILEKIAVKIKERQEGLAKVITNEMGKPITLARTEVAKSADYFKWFAEEARRVYGDVIPTPAKNKRMTAIKQPVGVVAVITPWNFPLLMLARKVATALAAGCTVVVRPSSETPTIAIELFEIFEECGLPNGVANLIIGPASELSDVLLKNEKVKKITFTGSTAIGKELIKGSADTVKRLSLELGGNAPFIVFEDADLEKAVEGLAYLKFRQAGQVCVTANRVYIQDSIYEEFEKKFVEKVAELKVGLGIDEQSLVGPVINEKAITKIENLIEDAVEKGAETKYGGHRVTDGECAKGTFFSPTILSNVTEDMKVMKEEIFGPVAPIIRFNSEEEVIKRANNTNYGLTAYCYTKDLARIYRVSEKLEYGVVGINDSATSVIESPFGGMKESGLGREGGKHIDEFLETKFISIIP
ncbi:NAD-dependent succinate-semialdehyde dehydrogenase [Oceanobacillus jeddahense]|uniref:NAD-dependent succinate-semialdehyde dehydrogenase n=1 Tax=Oceanobacillus jeddahense TaxID=1462527 RepID=UPI00362A71B6